MEREIKKQWGICYNKIKEKYQSTQKQQRWKRGKKGNRMRLDIERSFQFHKMTDREKRKAIDRELAEKNPDKPSQEIRQLRESFLAEYHDHRKHLHLPQPEKKQMNENRVLSVQELAENVARDYVDGIPQWLMILLWPLGVYWFLTSVIFLGVLFGPFSLEATYEMILGAVLTAVGYFWVHNRQKKKRKVLREQIVQKLLDGGWNMERYIVQDMGFEVESDSDGFEKKYYLQLRRWNARLVLKYDLKNFWKCEASYHGIREGDTVFLIYFDRKAFKDIMTDYDFKKQPYLLDADNWTLEEPLKQLLGI